ncbi:MAG: hypothetical protein KDA69_16990 [Planctomycetaceae bacterium]|nr:hypothetical protein [Planctomycetaceae bacterium]MCA9046027.1 hypothetical protein [Planctomycetaceae bacterium]
MDDFSLLEPSAHMLAWLSDDYQAAVRDEILNALRKQVPGSTLEALSVTSDPQWLTGAIPSEDDPDKAILVRTGVAFEISLVVQEPSGESHHLEGVYSWVGVNLNDAEAVQQRIWFDIGGKLLEFGSAGELAARMYFA